MNLVALLIVAGGLAIVAWIWLWARQRQGLGETLNTEQGMVNLPQAASGDALVVSSEHGQVIYVNEPARRWLGMNGGEPHLEYIVQMAQPSDSLLELFAGEGQASFQLGKRWVEASSHYIPNGTERRMVVRMRELSANTTNPDALDLNRAMRVINEIGETVNARMGLEEVLQALLAITSKTIPSEAGEVCLWVEKDKVLYQRGWIGDVRYLLDLAEVGGMYRLDEGISGWIGRHRKPVLVVDRNDPKGVQPRLDKNPYQSIVAVPLVLGQRFLGTFELFHMEPRRYSQADMALLQAVSTSMAVAIHNAELYGEQVQRINDMASLQQVVSDRDISELADVAPIFLALNQRIANLLSADMCGILLYNEERRALIAEPPFYGLPEHVVRGLTIPLPPGSPQRNIWDNQPYWRSNDLVDEPMAEAMGLMPLVNVAGLHNTALIPMQIGGRRIGIVAVSNKRTEGGFTPRDLQNLQVLAAQAAIVVENVQLFQREQRVDTELVGLQEITHAIGALSHEGEFYSEITERIAKLMEIQMCGILLFDEKTNWLTAQLPFYGVRSELIAHYFIDVKPGTIFNQLWTEEDYWYSNKVAADTLVFEAGLDQMAELAGVQKTLIAVLAAGGRRIGVVQVSNKLNSADFTDNDARLLLIFATQAAAIIENARLFRELQRSADQSQRLRRVAELAGSALTTEENFMPVLSEVANLTDSTFVYVNVLDMQTGSLITYPRWVYGTELFEPIIQSINTPGFENSVAVSHQPFSSNDVVNDTRVLPGYRTLAQRFSIKQAVIVPLVVGDRSLGELGVANPKDRQYTDDDVTLLATVSAQLAATMERLLLYEATGQNLIRRNEELDAISRVSNELTLTLDLDKVLDVIRHEAAHTTKAVGSTVALLKPFAEWSSPDKPELARRIGESNVLPTLADIEKEAVARGADTVLVSDYARGGMRATPPQALSAIAASVLYVDQVVGVIHLYHTEANRFDERAAAFLMTLATKAALGYGNAVRFQEQVDRSDRLRRRVEQLNQIYELGHMSNTDQRAILEAITEAVQQSVGFDAVVIALVDEATQTLTRVTYSGLPVDVFEKSKAKVLSVETLNRLFEKTDYRLNESYFFPVERVAKWYVEGADALSLSFEGNRTVELTGKNVWRDGDLLLVRLNHADGNLLGVMVLDRPYDNQRPDRSVVEVLEIFAHQAAIAVENARLYQSTIRSAEQEAHLNEVVEEVSRTLDINHIVRAVARGILGVTPFARMTVAVSDVQDQGFDVLKVTVQHDETFDIVKDHRPSLVGSALGHSFQDGVEYLYRFGETVNLGYQDLQSWRENGEKTTLVLPLLAGGQRLGALHLGSNEPNAAGLIDNQALLKRMAQIVASSVQNARLFNQALNLQAFSQSVVMSIQQGIVVLDNSGHIRSINDYMRQHYGWSEASAVGQDLFAYKSYLADFLATDVRTVLESGVPQERINQATTDEHGTQIFSNYFTYPLRGEGGVRGAVMMVEDVTERWKLEKAIEDRANQLAALTEVSSRITASLERDEVINLALEEMGWVIPYDTMTLWRRHGSFMVLEGAAGIEEFQDVSISDLIARDIRVRFSLYERVRQMVESQRVVVVSTPEPLKEGLPGDENARSWMGVPLVNQGHVIGMIVVAKHEPDFYDTASEQHVAFAFASQVAIALANADLFQQAFDRTNELGTLLEAAQATSLTRDLDDVYRTVVELMFSALDVDECAIMLWDEVDNAVVVQLDMNRDGDVPTEKQKQVTPKGTRYDLTKHPAKQVVLRDRDVVVITSQDEANPYPSEMEDLQQQGHAARLLVPLVVREQAIGLIQVEQRASSTLVTQQKVRLARALGAQVAIAIENARLSTETNHQFEELLLINDLSRAISGTLDLDDMIRIVRDQVPAVTGSDELYLALYDAETQQVNFPLAVRSGTEFSIPPRPVSNDEVSFIIKHRQPLSLGADYYGPEEMRRNLGITNGEGDAKSYMGVPLISGDQVLGVLAVRDTQRTRAFTLNDRRVLTTVGSQLGAAIQNAGLYAKVTHFADDLNNLVEERTRELGERTRELEEERDRIDTLYQITSELSQTLDMDRLLGRALGMVAKVVMADDGAIMLIDSVTDQLYTRASLKQVPREPDAPPPTHPGEAIATWLIDNDHDIVVDDLQTTDFWNPAAPGATEWRSALAVVLETNEDIQGVLVMLARRPKVFTEAHLHLVVAAANQIGSAINNADLYHLIRDQADRLRKLLRGQQEEAEKSSAILEGIADGVLLADASGNVILYNNAAERILEIPRDQIMGLPLSRLTGLYGSSASWVHSIQDWANRDWSVAPSDLGDFVDQRLDLGTKIVSIHLSPVHINEKFLGTVSVFRDITRDVEVDRLKSEFIANVSHELRTPMTSVKGYADLLLMGAAGEPNESQHRFLTVIKENADRLTSLVEDVLDIARIDSGREQLKTEPVDLDELIQSVMDYVQSDLRHQAKGMHVSINVGNDVPKIVADVDKLTQILNNLVDNAFNYTHAGGSIDINIQLLPDAKHVLISIKDTGIGIPEEFREAIWRRFERYEAHALVMDVAGTGLGLPIVKELVTMHHGSVWFESELGKGTTFYVELPIDQADATSTSTGTVEIVRLNPAKPKE